MARSSVIIREDSQASKMVDEDTLSSDQHVRWVFNSSQRIASMMVKGYRLVREEDGIQTYTGTEVRTPEGNIIDGDLILMVCDKQRVNKRREELDKVTQLRLRGPVEEFKHRLRKSGALNSRVVEDFNEKGE